MQDTDAGLLRSVREQHRLEELLITAMRVLGRRPESVRPGGGRRTTRAPRRNGYAGELDTGDARCGDDVVGIVRRQPDAAQLVGEAEPPEDLHRAGADLTALHVWWVVGRAALHTRRDHGRNRIGQLVQPRSREWAANSSKKRSSRGINDRSQLAIKSLYAKWVRVTGAVL